MKFVKTFVHKYRSRIQAFFDRDKERLEPAPYRDWAILVTLFFVSITLFTVTGMFTFVSVNDLDIAESLQDESGNVEKISIEELREVLQIYSDKEQKLEELMATPSFIADPSQ